MASTSILTSAATLYQSGVQVTNASITSTSNTNDTTISDTNDDDLDSTSFNQSEVDHGESD